MVQWNLKQRDNDVEAAVTDGIKTEMSFMTDCLSTGTSRKSTKEWSTKASITAMNNCKLDPAHVREARKAEVAYFQKMQVSKKTPVQKFPRRDGKYPDQMTRTSKCGPQVPQSAGDKRVQEVL